MKKAKIVILSSILTVILSCNTKAKNDEKPNAILNPTEILEKSIQYHDPNSNYDNTTIDIHIQEPRIQNPYRFSKLKFNIKDEVFELFRNRDNHVAFYKLLKNEASKVLLDGKQVKDTAIINKYRLQPGYAKGISKYYHLILGVPMSLKNETINVKGGDLTKFNNYDCYRIEVELKKSVISKYWHVFIDSQTYAVRGLELINEENPKKGERLIFEDITIINKIILAKIREWRQMPSNKYLGSDILLSNQDIMVNEAWIKK